MKRVSIMGLVVFLLGCASFSQHDTQRDSTQEGPQVRVGEEVPAKFIFSGSNVSSIRDRVLWTITLNEPDATYICPHFEHMSLPSGARVEVRSPDGSRAWTYTGQGKAGLGNQEKGFWAIHIPGDTAIVELISTAPVDPGAVRIDRYARGLEGVEVGFPEPPEPAEALCNADDMDWAKCYAVTEPEIYEHARAVARLLINGTSACTGWLVGDEGHLLTNQHCIGDKDDALNTTYEFMAEGACGQDCSDWGDCPGDIVADEAELIDVSSSYDYALVKLPVNASKEYGYLQLRASGAEVGERIYIPQHPAAKGKRIAVESSHSTDTTGYARIYSKSVSACFGVGSDVGYYADTQGGSSGSPVLGYDDHLVVALHHCANCPNRGVPIESVIGSLGSLLPASALGGDTSSTTPSDRIEIPSGANLLEVETSGGSGDADLYVREGSKPTLSEWDHRPNRWGND